MTKYKIFYNDGKKPTTRYTKGGDVWDTIQKFIASDDVYCVIAYQKRVFYGYEEWDEVNRDYSFLHV